MRLGKRICRSFSVRLTCGGAFLALPGRTPDRLFLTPAPGSRYIPFGFILSATQRARREIVPMDLHELTQLAVNFYYDYKWVVIIGAAILLLLVILKPKPMLKSIGILVGIAVAIYIVMLIGDMIFSGVEVKEQMIHKTP
jgi:hypothetical protein